MHPPLYPLHTAPRWLSFGARFLGWTDEEKDQAKLLLQKNFIPIMRGPEIGTLLGISTRTVSRASAVPEKYYRTFQLKKKSGGFRNISAPRVYLKVIQRYLLDCILAKAMLPANVVGFVRGKTLADGARIHVGKRYLWNIDLKDFFPSVTLAMSTDVFRTLGYKDEAAIFLGKICTLNGCLPQGAPTSPMLANLAFVRADIEIAALCEHSQVRFTRYADDLSFSSNTPISEEFRNSVLTIVAKFGFTVNPNKSRLCGPLCRREVTGLTVNTQLSVTRTARRKVRALVHKYSLSPESTGISQEQLIGHLNHISTYHPAEVIRYRKRLGL